MPEWELAFVIGLGIGLFLGAVLPFVIFTPTEWQPVAVIGLLVAFLARGVQESGLYGI